MFDILKTCSGLPEAHFETDDWLAREGETGGDLFVLITGEVVVLKGETEIVRVSDPGSIFGEIAALLEIPYTASVRALSPVRAYHLENGIEFIASNPAIALYAARVLAQRLNNATAYLADVKLQFADQKNHFAMMDRILDTLMLRQAAKAPQPAIRSDPRL